MYHHATAWCTRMAWAHTPSSSLHAAGMLSWQQTRCMGRFSFNRGKIERDRDRLEEMMSVDNLRVNMDIRAPQVRHVHVYGRCV